ncbi:MAG: addiction module protein [Gemmatimonadota bacterium]|nr:addiction module protein [Gemmatimonadota bacterium]
MTRKALLDEILRLPPDERLRLVEDIWDSLAAMSERVPVPAWHREELDRRLADRSEEARVSWDELRARLRRAEG